MKECLLIEFHDGTIESAKCDSRVLTLSLSTVTLFLACDDGIHADAWFCSLVLKLELLSQQELDVASITDLRNVADIDFEIPDQLPVDRYGLRLFEGLPISRASILFDNGSVIHINAKSAKVCSVVKNRLEMTVVWADFA